MARVKTRKLRCKIVIYDPEGGYRFASTGTLVSSMPCQDSNSVETVELVIIPDKPKPPRTPAKVWRKVVAGFRKMRGAA